MSIERVSRPGAISEAVDALGCLPWVIWRPERGPASNKALEATADDALGLPMSTWLLTPSVGGASV